MQSRIVSVMLAAFTLLIGSFVSGQSVNGVLAGTIYDQEGARLNRSVVTVRSADSNVEHSVHPNERGDYRFENLPAGRYSVRASAVGLTAVQINDVIVQANKTLAVNVTLPIADATPISVVQVSEAPQPIDATAPAATAPVPAGPRPAVTAPAAAPPPPQAQPLTVNPATAATPAPAPRDNAKAVTNEINGVRDRLALSAAQIIKIRVIFEDREWQIDNVRNDETLPMRVRREKIKTIREETEARFRSVLNENQTEEYEEILRERRERALEKRENLQSSH